MADQKFSQFTQVRPVDGGYVTGYSNTEIGGTFTVYMNNAAITDLTNIAVTNTLQNITLTTPLVYPAAAYFEIEYTGTLGLDYHSVTSHVTS